SRTTAMPEVLGNAAEYGDPSNPRSFTAPLRRLLEDAPWRALRGADGIVRAGEFHAQRTGAAMRALLAELD
ncbi:MAG: hypothetical protein O3A20_06805, partial [Planctomycetota bacterium]|nr:hypothetical protein [Planctomycetota bacterium]